MCTVSVADETQRSDEVVLKDMLNILEGMDPRRNWYSLSPVGTEKTRMMVPLSDAVARRVPVLLIDMQDNGDRWATTTFTVSSFEASKSRTSPVVGGMCVPLGGAWEGTVNCVGSAFWGSGYARIQLSDDDRAQIASTLGWPA
jgi:hypothetical protein